MFKTIFRLIERYNSYTQHNPAKSIIVSTGILMGAGDLLTQSIERYIQTKENSDNPSYKPKEFNKSRLAHMCIYGLAILGPFSYYWYVRILPKLVPLSTTDSKAQLMKKILIDQLINCGISYSTFVVVMTLLEGKSIKDEAHKIKNDFIKMCVSDLFIWPFVQYFNFKHAPIYMQALVVNIVSIFWNAYISNIHHTHHTNEVKFTPHKEVKPISQNDILKQTLLAL